MSPFERASADEDAAGAPRRNFDPAFRPDEAYMASLPDLQNGPESLIKGSHHRLQHVGCSNFRLPIAIELRDGSAMTLEASVTGTVSLEANKKGINMSRIIRSFYDHAREPFSFARLETILDTYLGNLGSADARIVIRFRLPQLRESLRSGLVGHQFYDAAFEAVHRDGARIRIMHLDYVYSSTCPCSLELAEHARRTRGILATPHAQRSVARLSVVLRGDVLAGSENEGCKGTDFLIEDLIDACRAQVPTETQVFVKREDEQAFAELNGANAIFVEDAARLFAEALLAEPRVGDFRVMASHQESLHSHDAVSILVDGRTFAEAGVDPLAFATMIHVG